MDEVKSAVPYLVVPVRALRGCATETVGRCPVQDGNAASRAQSGLSGQEGTKTDPHGRAKFIRWYNGAVDWIQKI